MGKLGVWEILLILLVVLVVFGGSKLSGVGKALGTSIREFKKEMKGDEPAEGEEAKADEEKKA
ncbi:MAG: twin-arginine translocase TatA/TatE family subunit [Clostridia bacterium]|nr:twin-arginine translocase TatA/TatE family subunit [Clostridia bacterium]